MIGRALGRFIAFIAGAGPYKELKQIIKDNPEFAQEYRDIKSDLDRDIAEAEALLKKINRKTGKKVKSLK
tara:strand:+ start:4059 stop:4268 length:210 start_codon:yes stop_codon:yes gene_type:complete